MAYPSPATSFSEIEIESSAPPPYHPPSANDFEVSTSASTADDINVKSSKYYGRDVFINHRGPDTKKTFASYLYRRLRVHGVEAFLDIEGMQEGEDISAQIKDAIETAAVHVAIFSPCYAESSWCLNELVDMLESKAPIIPVFYKVKPGDLKGKDGLYAEALRVLEKNPRHSSNTIENWRKALATVSKISGFELEACNGDEGMLLEKVVELLLKKVKREELYVANYPTGLDEKVRHFEGFLSQLPEKETKVAGIIGSGGIGKTTLAKELFNRWSSRYRKSCILFDVRNAPKSSLVGLQKKLLQRLLGFDTQIDSIDEGKKLLIEHLQSFSHSCMLIFDDVDHVDQLDALLPDEVKYTFPSNCLILITSRDKNVLLKSRIQDSSIYKLSGLNRKHSMELFCRHAFCQPDTLPGFQNLLESILGICGGLPLSLKVLGSLFHVNSDNTYWEGILSRIHGLPDIQQTLRISYDSLNEEEKHMFLYISCFLIGEKRDTAIKIWDQSGGKCFVFQNLQNKSLVEVDTENCIHMHDHLRELGRENAEDSGFHNPRLWDRTENDNIAVLLRTLKQSDNRDVRGIRMVPSADVGHELKSYASLQSDMSWFKRRTHELLGKRMMKLSNRWHKILYPGITMNNLHLLITEDHLLERILRTAALPNLRWLRWYKCGHSSLPSWIPMENLRVLYVNGNALKILWQGKAQAPLQLRELEILAPLSKFPKSIRQLKHLEQIYISLPEQNNMSSLPEEFCELLSLKRFELINAWKMKSLPDSIGNLVKLEYLNLSGSRNLERLPDSFEDLVCLKYLDLRGTDNLIISTRNHGNIPSGTVGRWLKLLACRRMEREKSVKEETSRREKVEEGDLWEEREEEERRECEWRKERLMEKEREGEREWAPTRRRMDELESRWRVYREREWAPTWSRMDELESKWRVYRRLYWFKSVERPSGWRALMEWEERVWKEWRAERKRECKARRESEDRWEWELAWARERERWRCDQHAWSFKLFCRHLKEGEEARRAVMMNPPPLPLQLPRSLQELHIAELPLSFENLCNLEILELDGSVSKMLPPSPSDLRNLKELRLLDCPRWKCLPDSLGQLTVLEVARCRGLVEVGTLPSTLIQLSIISCPNLEKIDGLRGLAKLQTLNISGWRKVEELADIETLVSLEQLRASGCEKLKRIHGLWQLTKLKLLDVHGCREIEELEGVEHLRSLEMLDASDCPGLYWDSRVLEQLPQPLKKGMLYI